MILKKFLYFSWNICLQWLSTNFDGIYSPFAFNSCICSVWIFYSLFSDQLGIQSFSVSLCNLRQVYLLISGDFHGHLEDFFFYLWLWNPLPLIISSAKVNTAQWPKHEYLMFTIDRKSAGQKMARDTTKKVLSFKYSLVYLTSEMGRQIRTFKSFSCQLQSSISV